MPVNTEKECLVKDKYRYEWVNSVDKSFWELIDFICLTQCCQ